MRFSAAVSVVVLALTCVGCPSSKATNEVVIATVEVSPACSEARSLLGAKLRSLSRTCSVEADCEAVYLGVDSCDAPIAIAKGYDSEHDAALFEAQGKVRAACPARGGPPCAPRRMRVACQTGRCVGNGP